MALKAGRVGVLPDQVSAEGKLVIEPTAPAYYGKLGVVMPGDTMSINSAGVINVNTLSTPQKIYITGNDSDGYEYSEDIGFETINLKIFVIETHNQGSFNFLNLYPLTGYEDGRTDESKCYFLGRVLDNGDLVSKIYECDLVAKTVSLIGTITQEITTATV